MPLGQNNGGLERIAAQAMGDAARATKMGDSKSTTKVLPLGRWGMPCGQQKMGDSKSARKIADRAMGDAAQKKNGGLKRIAAWAMGDTARATKMGDSKSTTKVSPLGQ